MTYLSLVHWKEYTTVLLPVFRYFIYKVVNLVDWEIAKTWWKRIGIAIFWNAQRALEWNGRAAEYKLIVFYFECGHLFVFVFVLIFLVCTNFFLLWGQQRTSLLRTCLPTQNSENLYLTKDVCFYFSSKLHIRKNNFLVQRVVEHVQHLLLWHLFNGSGIPLGLIVFINKNCSDAFLKIWSLHHALR